MNSPITHAVIYGFVDDCADLNLSQQKRNLRSTPAVFVDPPQGSSTDSTIHLNLVCLYYTF